MKNWVEVRLTGTTPETSVLSFRWWIGPSQDSIGRQPRNIGLKLSQSVLRHQLAVPASRRSVCGVTFLEPPPVPALDVAVPRGTPLELRLSRLFGVAVTGVVHPKVTSNDVPSPAIVKITPSTGQYDSGVCAICYKSPQLIRSWPPCGHVFCFKCLYRWSEILVNRSGIDWNCPFCNQFFNTFQQENGIRYNLLWMKKEKVRPGFMDYFKQNLHYFILISCLIILPTCALCIYSGSARPWSWEGRIVWTFRDYPWKEMCKFFCCPFSHMLQFPVWRGRSPRPSPLTSATVFMCRDLWKILKQLRK